MSMQVSEIRRLEAEFGWSPNLEQLESENSYANKNWTTIQSAYSDDQTAWLNEGGTSSWWYDTRNSLILRGLEKIGMNDCLWDIGGGPGIVSSYLIGHGISCVGVEPSRSGVLASGQRGVPSIESDLESLALPSASVSCIGLFDVLEHVNDRPRLLREIRRVLKKDGHLIMTVPSLTWLWSQSDLDVGHFLRYSKRSVRAELKNSGFLVRSSRYFFVSIVLPLFVLRSIPFRLGFRQPVDDGVLLNQGGGIMGKILQKFETAISGFTPLGTSLLVIATPSDTSS
jgi:ubiquinone/menaquinone biosynthesis C-methylase UbiE